MPSEKDVFNVSSISWAGTGFTLLLSTLLEAVTFVEPKERSTEDLHCGKFSATDVHSVTEVVLDVIEVVGIVSLTVEIECNSSIEKKNH